MSRGFGWLERAVLDLLHRNEHMAAPELAAIAYAADAPDAPPAAPERVPPPTAAQQQAVRRALSNLQKRGLVVKLGHLFNGERCSYADREHALLIARKYVRCFGNQALGDHRRLAELYADNIAAEA